MEKNKGQSVSTQDAEVQQKLEQLKGEYSRLNEQRIATDRDKKNLEEQLRVLRDKALRDYGTSDIEDLRKLLEERRRENEQMVEEYRAHIMKIKEDLQEIEETGAAKDKA